MSFISFHQVKNKFVQLFCASFLILLTQFAHAEDFLDPEVAFKVSAKMLQPGLIEVKYTIADGYYLYREKLKFSAEGAKLGEAAIPKGKVKFDETFQKDVETFRSQLTVKIPVQAQSDFVLHIGRQGCADQGLCYPPMDTEIKLTPPAVTSAVKPVADVLSPAASSATPANLNPLNAEEKPKADTVSQEASASNTASVSTASVPVQTSEIPASIDTDAKTSVSESAVDSESSSISTALKSGKLSFILPLFFLLGLGLSFTPCVLPMVPILSFIIVGEGVNVKRSRGFLLSLSYSLGMALVYTALGVAAGLLGEGLAATLQNPWVLGTFALLMVVLSLSMFGVYQLQVPASLQSKLTVASEGQRNGKLIGVFLMGAISALIVGPCVAAPLAGALVYISQTRDVMVGGSALFSMAMGMSVPLLLVGISAGSLLPRAGVWMEAIKRFFGVLMLAMAIWMVTPVLPVWLQMLCWATLLMSYGIYQLFINKGGNFSKFIAVIFSVLGLMQLIGVTSGGRDVFSPLAHVMGTEVHSVKFTRVHSVEELDAALSQSKGKVAMLDFYADWCVSCKEMEKLTFTDKKVQEKLADVLLLQADVTANNEADKALLKRFGLFGPPGIIFFDAKSQEIKAARVIGYQNAEKFLKSLTAID